MIIRAHPKQLSHYRPRILTLFVMGLIAAIVTLANLSDDVCRRAESVDINGRASDVAFDARERRLTTPAGGVYGEYNVSFGWPMLWRQYVLAITPIVPSGVFACCYSPARLGLNLVLWLIIVAAPGAACECLLRRYRPGFRWSLRTLLATVALVAAMCAWSTAAWKRGSAQDKFVAAGAGPIWIKRWGPRWLDVNGADRYFRQIVGAMVVFSPAAQNDKDANKEDVLRLSAKLPHLQYLRLEVDSLTPAMFASISNMHQLRTLSIQFNGATPEVSAWLAKSLDGMRQLRALELEQAGGSRDHAQRIWDENMAAIGRLTELESLRLETWQIRADSLTRLAGLTNLRTLDIQLRGPASGDEYVYRLPRLPRLNSPRFAL